MASGSCRAKWEKAQPAEGRLAGSRQPRNRADRRRHAHTPATGKAGSGAGPPGGAAATRRLRC